MHLRDVRSHNHPSCNEAGTAAHVSNRGARSRLRKVNALRKARTILFGAAVIASLSGCATLTGVPQGLSPKDVTDLGSQEVPTVLAVGDRLYARYADATFAYRKYTFWTGAAYIPLAAIASWAVYAKASHDVLAGTGILAGSVAGASLLVNAKDNQAAYATGMVVVRCVQAPLTVFVTSTRSRQIGDLTSSNDALRTEIGDAQSLLKKAGDFDFGNPEAAKEIKSDPRVISQFNTAQKDLSDALTAANTAAKTAQAEIDGFGTLPSLAKNSFEAIDLSVTSKVAPGTVDYASLQKSITAAITASMPSGDSKAGASASSQAQRTPSHEPKQVDKTPIKTAVDAMSAEAASLTKVAATISDQAKATGVASAQITIQDCLKKL